MKRLIAPILVLLAGPALFFNGLSAQIMPVPAPPSLSAPSYILLDYASGSTLVEHNPDEPREPASLVKLMTGYVVFSELKSGHLQLEDEVTVSEKAWRMGGSRMFIEVGRTVVVEDLLRGLIVQSGNDASVALAEHVAGNEETFAQLMNQYAERLGMHNTTFANATGWPDPNQITTARDIATLARAMIRDFPEYYSYYSERSFTFNDITQQNRNMLLFRDDTVDGLKTGHTSSAGYNLVSSALREEMRLVAAVMGTDGPGSRADQSQALFNYGFRFFRSYRLYEQGEALVSPRLWKGSSETIPLGLAESMHITIPQRQYDNLDASLRVDSPLVAPVRRGQKLGEVVVRLEGQIVAEAPLIALEDGEEAGFFGRLLDEFMLLFQ
ncbi:MAG: D-alanyl-D-alanine carboxypeptidase family protein [Aquisalimonadaceae bacterium]